MPPALAMTALQADVPLIRLKNKPCGFSTPSNILNYTFRGVASLSHVCHVCTRAQSLRQARITEDIYRLGPAVDTCHKADKPSVYRNDGATARRL
jgi:hypothetical protein